MHDDEGIFNNIFLKVTYPMNEGMNVMFLTYNWLYVNQYLKTALYLPIMLTRRSMPQEQVV